MYYLYNTNNTPWPGFEPGNLSEPAILGLKTKIFKILGFATQGRRSTRLCHHGRCGWRDLNSRLPRIPIHCPLLDSSLNAYERGNLTRLSYTHIKFQKKILVYKVMPLKNPDILMSSRISLLPLYDIL